MRQRGFSLYGLVAALFLGGIISMLCIRELHDLAKVHGTLIQRISFLRNSALIIPHLQRALYAQDAHRLPLALRSAPNELRFQDGALVSSGIAQASDSDALYYLTAAPGPPIPLLEREIQDISLHARICPATPPEVRNGAFDAIAITPQGISEVRCTIPSPPYRGCMTVTLTPTSGLVYQNIAVEDLLTIAAIVPLAEKAVLFVDTKENARLLRLHGASIIENQPLSSYLKGIRCNIQQDTHQLHTLSCTLMGSQDKTLGIHLRNRLSRESYINILLNL